MSDYPSADISRIACWSSSGEFIWYLHHLALCERNPGLEMKARVINWRSTLSGPPKVGVLARRSGDVWSHVCMNVDHSHGTQTMSRMEQRCWLNLNHGNGRNAPCAREKRLDLTYMLRATYTG